MLLRRRESFPSFPSLFDGEFPDDIWPGWHRSPGIPAVNVRETPEQIEVEVAAPGMSRDDFHIGLDGGVLTISSEKKTETGDDQYSRREFSYQSFRRSFSLPKDLIDDEAITARYEDGILRLTLPKRPEQQKKEPRRIEIAG